MTGAIFGEVSKAVEGYFAWCLAYAILRALLMMWLSLSVLAQLKQGRVSSLQQGSLLTQNNPRWVKNWNPGNRRFWWLKESAHVSWLDRYCGVHSKDQPLEKQWCPDPPAEDGRIPVTSLVMSIWNQSPIHQVVTSTTQPINRILGTLGNIFGDSLRAHFGGAKSYALLGFETLQNVRLLMLDIL